MTLTWKQLASIEIGGAICLPVILVGHALCMRYGLPTALTAIVLGNVFLLGLGLISARLSVFNRKSTPEQALTSFGQRGVNLLAMALMVTKLGWFAIQLSVLSQSVQETLRAGLGMAPPLPLLNVVFGLAIVVVALFGLRAISILSSASLPIMAVTLLLALYACMGSATPIVADRGFEIEAISVTIAAAITAVLDMPTYFRFAKSPKDAIIAVTLLFTVCLPVVEAVGVILASYHPEQTLVATLQSGHLLWNIWMMVFLVIAAWTTINTNLYSASVSFGVLFKKLAEPKRMMILGLGGILLSMLPLVASFTLVLQVMGCVIGAFGGVMYTAYFTRKWGRESALPIVALSLAVLTGWMTLFKVFTLTSMPLVDSFLIATIGTILLSKSRSKQEVLS